MIPSTTKISKIYDHVISSCKAAFPDHQRLRDPEDISNNDAPFLTKGWGIMPADGERVDRQFSCPEKFLGRDFEVVLTREIVGTEDNVEARDEVTKLLLEDLQALINQLGQQPSVFIESEQLAFNFQYERDSGPRLISKEDKPYLFIEATLGVEYSEPVTGGI